MAVGLAACAGHAGPMSGTCYLAASVYVGRRYALQQERAPLSCVPCAVHNPVLMWHTASIPLVAHSSSYLLLPCRLSPMPPPPRAGDHGSTFAGNPLVCHAACTVFDIIADPAFLAAVELKGQRLRAGGCGAAPLVPCGLLSWQPLRTCVLPACCHTHSCVLMHACLVLPVDCPAPLGQRGWPR